MKIILLKDNTSGNGTICISGHKLLFCGLGLLVVLPICLAAVSYWLVSSIDRSFNPFIDPEYRIAVETRLSEQQQDVQKTRDYVRKHMDVLGRRVGSLQAQVSRINAVEQRIADTSGINLDDFQFDEDPPVGGVAASDAVDSEQIDIENALVAIEKELSLRESEIAAVDFLLSRNSLNTKQTPTGWPVKGGWVSSNFGMRLHPISGKKQFHRGVDIPGKEGGKVLAVADGVVVKSTKASTFGWMIQIDHGDGYTTLYSHNRKNLVSEGETVIKGQAIGEIGSTGLSTGPHVHFEVSKNDRSINPVKYLYRKS